MKQLKFILKQLINFLTALGLLYILQTFTNISSFALYYITFGFYLVLILFHYFDYKMREREEKRYKLIDEYYIRTLNENEELEKEVEKLTSKLANTSNIPFAEPINECDRCNYPLRETPKMYICDNCGRRIRKE